MRDAQPAAIYLNDYRPPDYLVERTELHFDLRMTPGGGVAEFDLRARVARVRRVDTSKAEAIPGFVGVLRASEVPPLPAPGDQILTDEPLFIGQPVLAVAAVGLFVLAKKL